MSKLLFSQETELDVFDYLYCPELTQAEDIFRQEFRDFLSSQNAERAELNREELTDEERKELFIQELDKFICFRLEYPEIARMLGLYGIGNAIRRYQEHFGSNYMESIDVERALLFAVFYDECDWSEESEEVEESE
jgi:hypothetical protein